MIHGKIAMFLGGTLFGTAGLKILGSRDAKKVYTHITAAVLRCKDQIVSDVETIQENCSDILADANLYGIQVIFHGCTLPRGWERMYPNFVASEAVLASENVFFNPYHAQNEGVELTLHPFIRNAVASMDWGGVTMNKYLSRQKKS